MSAAYRFRQGVRALAAWFSTVDDDLARQYLTPDLFVLYRRMRRTERQHSVRVLQELIARGATQPDLLTAALLHDVGKSRTHFFLPEKVLVVLVRAAAPHRMQQWGSGPAQGWRRPFAVSVQHPAWGAEMVAAAGGSPRAVDLIRRHAEPAADTDPLLRALQAVDDQN